MSQPSDEEETTIKSAGFSLNIPKYNVRSTKNRQKKNTNASSVSSDRGTYDGASATYSDATIKNRSSSDSDNPGSRKKKRPRKEVMASISANAKRMKIPIPSFKMMMMKDRKTNEDSHSTKLSRLERAFFDDDDDENENVNDDNDDTTGKNTGSDSGDERDNSTKTDKEKQATDSNCNDKTNNTNNTMSSSSAGKPGGAVRSKNSNLSIIVEHDSDETESEDSDFNEEFSSSVFSRPKQIQKQKEQQTELKSKSSNIVQQVQQITTEEVVDENISVGKDDRNEDFNNIISSSSSSSTTTTTTISGGSKKKSVEVGVTSNTEGYEKMAEDDTNFVDFGEGECDFDDMNDKKDVELSVNYDHDKKDKQMNSTSSTITTLTTRSIQSTANSSKQALVSPPFNLEREIDHLFLKTDTNTITMKMFSKTLESMIGRSLDKETKRKVKARVMSLLKGEINPPTTNATKNFDDNTSSKDKIEVVEEKNDVVKSNNAESNSKTVMEKGEEEKNGLNEAKLSTTETQDIVETSRQMIVIDENSCFDCSEKEEAEKVSTVESENPITQKKDDESDRNQKKDTQRSKTSTQKKNLKSNNVQTETKKRATKPGSNKMKSNSKTSKEKRPRKNKPTTSDRDDDKPTTTEAATSIPAAKPNRPRKRARKAAACALCRQQPRASCSASTVAGSLF